MKVNEQFELFTLSIEKRVLTDGQLDAIYFQLIL